MKKFIYLYKMKSPLSFLFIVLGWLNWSPLWASQCAALKAKEVNWRKIPGPDEPILWVYRCPGWPVVVEKRFGHWCLVKDYEGIQGWVNALMLSFKPTLLVIEDMTALRSGPCGDNRVIAYLKKGVIVRYKKHNEKDKGWYMVETLKEKISGWIPSASVWPDPTQNAHE